MKKAPKLKKVQKPVKSAKTVKKTTAVKKAKAVKKVVVKKAAVKVVSLSAAAKVVSASLMRFKAEAKAAVEKFYATLNPPHKQLLVDLEKLSKAAGYKNYAGMAGALRYAQPNLRTSLPILHAAVVAKKPIKVKKVEKAKPAPKPKPTPKPAAPVLTDEQRLAALAARLSKL